MVRRRQDEADTTEVDEGQAEDTTVTIDKPLSTEVDTDPEALAQATVQPTVYIGGPTRP